MSFAAAIEVTAETVAQEYKELLHGKTPRNPNDESEVPVFRAGCFKLNGEIMDLVDYYSDLRANLVNPSKEATYKINSFIRKLEAISKYVVGCAWKSCKSPEDPDKIKSSL